MRFLLSAIATLMKPCDLAISNKKRTNFLQKKLYNSYIQRLSSFAKPFRGNSGSNMN